MNDNIAVKYVTDPRQLPPVFIALPENWQSRLSVLEKLGRLTNIKLGDVFIYETPMGRSTWRIIGAEVLNAEELLQTDQMGEKNETI